jgi:hypothetical protein
MERVGCCNNIENKITPISMKKHLKFEFLDEFWLYAFGESKAYNRESRVPKNQWSGNVSWNEAKVLAMNGWIEGLEEIKKYAANYTEFIAEKVIRPMPYYQVTGDYVDVGVFLANDPECFVARGIKEIISPGKVYKVVCSISFSAAIKPETIIQRGAMICALIDAIELSGNRVEIVCNSATSADQNSRRNHVQSRGWFEVDVVVKEVAQPLDMGRIAFSLAHPAMFRRIIFSVMEREGWSDYAYRYGYPSEATDQGDIYIQEIFSGVVPDHQAIQWVLNKLMEMGIQIKESDS